MFMKDIIRKVLNETINEKEIEEKTRTLKNARKVTLYPKSAKRANPLRFRPELREDSVEYGNNLSPEQLTFVQSYIEKNGKLNWEDLKFAGIDWRKNHRQIYRLLSKKIGSRDNILNIIDELILNKIHTVDDCGTYDFNFIVDNYDLEKDTDGVYFINEVDCIVDPNGTVNLINLSDETFTFKKLFSDRSSGYEEFLWEVNYEMQDCIAEKLTELLSFNTGVVISDIRIKFDKKERFK